MAANKTPFFNPSGKNNLHVWPVPDEPSLPLEQAPNLKYEQISAFAYMSTYGKPSKSEPQ